MTKERSTHTHTPPMAFRFETEQFRFEVRQNQYVTTVAWYRKNQDGRWQLLKHETTADRMLHPGIR